MQYMSNLYTVEDIAVNMELYDDIRSILETEIQPEEDSATELISPVQFLRDTNDRSVKQSVDIRESVDAWPRRLRHKLYKRLRNKLYNDNWPFSNNNNDNWSSLSNDVAEFTYRVLWIT